MKLEYNGVEYSLAFNINVMADIQRSIGSFSQWCEDVGEKEPKLDSLIIGFAAMVNEATDIENEENETKKPYLTKNQVGRMLSKYSIGKLAIEARKELVNAVSSGESKNAQSTSQEDR